jgi:hypothetical protein
MVQGWGATSTKVQRVSCLAEACGHESCATSPHRKVLYESQNECLRLTGWPTSGNYRIDNGAECQARL